ncbi:MAG: hypothetical protein DYG89_00035 [Caldilinea sp. CFX5]|nr:hypothetical protein [Caldilinea sp. CFX5]
MQADSDSTTNNLPPDAPSQQSLLLLTTGYFVVLMVVIGAMLLILRYGVTLVAPVAVTANVITATAAKSEPLIALLIALIAVILTGLALGKLFAYLGQPPVIGEVVAGIVLGPSLLGPELSAYLLPSAAAPYLWC